MSAINIEGYADEVKQARAKQRQRGQQPGAGGGADREQTDSTDALANHWPEPIDIIGAPELVGWPTLTADCLPEPLYPLRHGGGRAPECRPVPARGSRDRCMLRRYQRRMADQAEAA